MASGGISTESDVRIKVLTQNGGAVPACAPAPGKLPAGDGEVHGRRHESGLGPGQVACVENAVSLLTAMPASALPGQAQAAMANLVVPRQQQPQPQKAGCSQPLGQSVAVNPNALPKEASSSASTQQRLAQKLGAGGNPRPHQQSAQSMLAPASSRFPRPQVQINLQSQEGTLEGRAQAALTRPLANMGQLQAGPSSVTTIQQGKPQSTQRIQISPQEKGVLSQSHAALQRPVMHRAPPRNSGLQPLPPSHPAQISVPRVYSSLQQSALSSQTRAPQAPQHFPPSSLAGVSTQQLVQQQQIREAAAAGSKPMSAALPPLPQYPVMRPAASGTSTPIPSDSGYRERAVDNHVVVSVSDRKVRLSSEADPTSLYALCRRWVRNDVPRKDQPGLWDCVIPLPRPLSAEEVDKSEVQVMENGKKSEDDFPSEVESIGSVNLLTEDQLLQSYIRKFKNVRKRSRDERSRRIARFKPRLALLLPCNTEAS